MGIDTGGTRVNCGLGGKLRSGLVGGFGGVSCGWILRNHLSDFGMLNGLHTPSGLVWRIRGQGETKIPFLLCSKAHQSLLLLLSLWPPMILSFSS